MNENVIAEPASPTRPLLRYHGAKWRLADRIMGHFPPHEVYVEPYGGGAGILLKKQRAKAEVYNDLDRELVNLFFVVRDKGPELVRALELTPFARDEFDLSYAKSADPVEQARRTLLRSHGGFGTAAWRTNLDGTPQRTGFRASGIKAGTIPAIDWRNYPGCLPAIIERLRGVVIENRDAIEVMDKNDGPTTLHYVDPPYVPSTRSYSQCNNFAIYRHEMTDDDHRKLLAFLPTLKGAVVLSGYAHPMYDEALPGWTRVEIPTHADGAKDRTEILWTHNCDHGLFTTSS